MSKIVEADINTIANNPFRRLHDYPYIDSKLSALMSSIREVGLWESVIARPLEDRLWKYEIAFGHHRVEACRRLKLKTIKLVVDDLNDKQMLQYMGRENLEDYNAVFLIQLEAWEAALKSRFISAAVEKRHQPLEIAKLLGWIYISPKNSVVLNETADACDAAYALIETGRIPREEFEGLSVSAARAIATRAYSLIKQTEKMAKGSKRPAHEIEAFKRHIGKGAADTAKQVRAGAVAHRDIRSHVDFNASIRSHKAPRTSPLFAVFANAIADNLRRTLSSDNDSQRLVEIEKALQQISMIEDWEALSRLKLELQNLGKRAGAWEKRLTPPQDKVVHFKALETNKGEVA